MSLGHCFLVQSTLVLVNEMCVSVAPEKYTTIYTVGHYIMIALSNVNTLNTLHAYKTNP